MSLESPHIMKYPAKDHARRTVEILKKSESTASESLILLSAAPVAYKKYSDREVPFHQNRYFNYFTGAHNLPGAHVTYDASKDVLTLYLPDIDWDDVMWSGMPLSVEQALELYDVDKVKYAADLSGDVYAHVRGSILVIEQTSVVGNAVVSQTLFEALNEARAFKDSYELSLLRKAAEITDISHRAVMSALPIEQSEGHIHAEFVYHSMRQGAKNVAYDPICCSGTNCGTLHYVRNDQDLDGKQLVLIDAGAEWELYAADVTRTFPISGEWTPESLAIYKAVLDMQTQAMEAVRPGVLWDDLHILTHRLLVRHFLKLGIFKGGSEDEILESRISAAFYPHGLGHMLGMETHDTAGYPNYQDADPILRYLRIRRELEEGMYVTVEPGIYFNRFLIEPVLKDESKAKYVDQQVLEKYWAVGGVRLEDDVLVTKDGFENFTKIIKDPEEVSKLVKEGISKGRNHFHNLI